MRVLIVTPDFPPGQGGIQLLIERLGRELASDEVVIACPDQPGAAALDATLPFEVRRVSAVGPRQAAILRLSAQLPGIARETKPDVVLSGHIVCAPGAHVVARLIDVPVVQYVYAMELRSRAHIARWALGRAERVIAISHYAEHVAVAAGADPGRIAVVLPGVDPPPAPVCAQPAVEPGILTIARLNNRYKGIDVMLRAMPLVLSQVAEARWTIIGDGRLRAEYEPTSVRARLAEQVTFLGRCSDAERDKHLSAARVFVMPSRVPPGGGGEGFGIVYLEAGRFGVPSVAGRGGGGAEAVLDGQTGTLVDPNDHIAIAEAVTELLCDDERCARYGAAAHTRATELSWSRMAAGVRATLETAIAR